MKPITSLQQYYEISMIVDHAKEALVFGGEEDTGIHFTLSWMLRGFGLVVNSREDSVRLGKQLLRDYEKRNLSY